jgi:hypothetical protein
MTEGHFRLWHEPDQPGRYGDVRCLGKTGSDRPTVKTTRLDPERT